MNPRIKAVVRAARLVEEMHILPMTSEESFPHENGAILALEKSVRELTPEDLAECGVEVGE